MRIGIDARSLAPPRRGVGHYLHQILLRLIRQDSQNEYFLYSHKEIDFDVSSNRRWHKRIGQGLLCRVGTLWLQTGVVRWARQDKLDVFWGPSHILPWLLPKKTKKLLTVHDLVWIFFPQTMNLFNLLVHKVLVASSIRIADSIICVSSATASALRQKFRLKSDRVKTIHSGIEWEKFAEKPGDAEQIKAAKKKYQIDGPYLLYIGTIEPRKNLARLLSAYEKVAASGRPEKLVIIGPKGWKTAGLTNNQPGLVTTGFVAEAEKIALLKGAEAFVFPSLYEGFGFPVLEAFACAKPTITSHCSSLEEIAGNAAYLIDPYDVNELARAIEKVLTDQALRQKLSEAGPKRAASFTWDKTIQEILKEFEELKPA